MSMNRAHSNVVRYNCNRTLCRAYPSPVAEKLTLNNEEKKLTDTEQHSKEKKSKKPSLRYAFLQEFTFAAVKCSE